MPSPCSFFFVFPGLDFSPCTSFYSPSAPTFQGTLSLSPFRSLFSLRASFPRNRACCLPAGLDENLEGYGEIAIQFSVLRLGF